MIFFLQISYLSVLLFPWWNILGHILDFTSTFELMLYWYENHTNKGTFLLLDEKIPVVLSKLNLRKMMRILIKSKKIYLNVFSLTSNIEFCETIYYIHSV